MLWRVLILAGAMVAMLGGSVSADDGVIGGGVMGMGKNASAGGCTGFTTNWSQSCNLKLGIMLGQL